MKALTIYQHFFRQLIHTVFTMALKHAQCIKYMSQVIAHW